MAFQKEESTFARMMKQTWETKKFVNAGWRAHKPWVKDKGQIMKGLACLTYGHVDFPWRQKEPMKALKNGNYMNAYMEQIYISVLWC